MQSYAPYLEGLAGQSRAMADLVADWVGVSTASHDVKGLAVLTEKVKVAFAALGGSVEELSLLPQREWNALGMETSLPLGMALRFRKRPEARLQVFLGIHLDVVYGSGAQGGPGNASVTPVIRQENEVMHASGAADAKGGLVIMLKALEAFEASPFAKQVGWEVLVNPDEELSSPGSQALFAEAAARNHLGLLFEPSLPNGNLVGARKGSGNFTAVVRGRAAHAGRDPHFGRNAVHALAHLIVELEGFGKDHPGLDVNVGRIEGGGPVNRVPDLAIAKFNLRVREKADQEKAEAFLQRLAGEYASRFEVALEIHGRFAAPPKPMTDQYHALLNSVRKCGLQLGLDLQWEASGGVSDGNRLAAAGLVNVDTLGAVGGNIHSPREFLILDSLVERSRLTALILMQLGSGEIAWPPSVVKGV